MIDIVTLFIGRTYCIEKYLDALAILDYPKNELNLIWHDTSHNPAFSKRLTLWLKEHGDNYNSTKHILCDEPHYHFEDKGESMPKATQQIVEAYNHCREFLTGEYMLAFEDDTIPPADGLTKLIHLVKENVKAACGWNMYRPSSFGKKGQPILWNFVREETFPNESIKEMCTSACLWDKEIGTGVEMIGSGHLGFTLIDGDWVRKNPFEFLTGAIGGCDTIVGLRMMQQGYQYAVDWSLKCKHYDIDGTYI